MNVNPSRHTQHNPAPGDGELMMRVRAGDRAAFKRIYERYSTRVYGYVWRMLHDDAAAEDIRQEAFIRLWQARTTWTERGSVGGFLIRAARNLALNSASRAQVRSRPDIGIRSGSRMVADSPDVVIEKHDLETRINAAIEELPARAREVFTLKRDAGLSYKEIAALLDISAKTVEAHMGKAYALLRQSLADIAP